MDGATNGFKLGEERVCFGGRIGRSRGKDMKIKSVYMRVGGEEGGDMCRLCSRDRGLDSDDSDYAITRS